MLLKELFDTKKFTKRRSVDRIEYYFTVDKLKYRTSISKHVVSKNIGNTYWDVYFGIKTKNDNTVYYDPLISKSGHEFIVFSNVINAVRDFLEKENIYT